FRCSHNFAPTSVGPGMADLPWLAVAPTSLAYSGSMFTAGPLPAVPSCQTAMNSAKRSSETSAARKPRSDRTGRRSDALNGEALHVLLGLRRIEFLSHDLEALGARCRRGKPDLLHQLCRVGCEEDLLGYCLVIDVALDLAPALHLREDPDRERLPGE